MNAMKTSLMGLTVAAVFGMSTLAMAAPEAKQQAKPRPQLTEQQKTDMAQKHFDRRYGDLKLSKAQQTKIKAVETQYRTERPAMQVSDAERQTAQANMEKLRAERLNVIQAKNFDAAQAQQLFSQEQAMRDQMQQKHQQQRATHQLNELRKEHAIYQILDSKQQQQYLEQAKKPRPMMARGGKHKMHKGGQHMGQRAANTTPAASK